MPPRSPEILKRKSQQATGGAEIFPASAHLLLQQLLEIRGTGSLKESAVPRNDTSVGEQNASRNIFCHDELWERFWI